MKLTKLLVFVGIIVVGVKLMSHAHIVRMVRYDTPAPYDTIVVWPEVGR